MAILHEAEYIGPYKVQNLIKSNLYTETYRVEDKDENPYFLKLFVLKRMPRKLVNDNTGIVKEIEYCQQLKHKGIVSFIDSGTFEHEESNCQYYVTNYFSGRLLAQRIQDEGTLKEDEAVTIFRAILESLRYLHSQSPILCHNDLDPTNILLSDLNGGGPEIIDLGHLSERCAGSVWFDTSDINPLYHANETCVSIFDEQGDVFSSCAILYTMLTGHAPWEMEIQAKENYKERINEVVQYRKKNKIDIDSLPVKDNVKAALVAGLMLKSSERAKSVDELITLLDGVNKPTEKKPASMRLNQPNKSAQQSNNPNFVEFEIKKGAGKGFEDIAGMMDLKETLNKQVIFVIKNEEIAKEYKINPPNGMLLYGPPGCGKTYFAEKFAEETGFSYMLVKSSDLGSSLVHGSQNKISQMFEQAAKNAPIVLCLDEFDALVPDRSWNNASAEEVNEFLTQMNNCAKRGIFIVATTNRPDKIDSAVLRTGRIDKMVYVPLPDFEARREMFNLYLKGRPIEENIDVDILAKLTDGYIASDIACIVNDAAIIAAYTREKISYELLQKSIRNTHPSLRTETVKIYEGIKRKMEDKNRKNITDRAVVNPW